MGRAAPAAPPCSTAGRGDRRSEPVADRHSRHRPRPARTAPPVAPRLAAPQRGESAARDMFGRWAEPWPSGTGLLDRRPARRPADGATGGCGRPERPSLRHGCGARRRASTAGETSRHTSGRPSERTPRPREFRVGPDEEVPPAPLAAPPPPPSEPGTTDRSALRPSGRRPLTAGDHDTPRPIGPVGRSAPPLFDGLDSPATDPIEATDRCLGHAGSTPSPVRPGRAGDGPHPPAPRMVRARKDAGRRPRTARRPAPRPLRRFRAASAADSGPTAPRDAPPSRIITPGAAHPQTAARLPAAPRNERPCPAGPSPRRETARCPGTGRGRALRRMRSRRTPLPGGARVRWDGFRARPGASGVRTAGRRRRRRQWKG